MSRERATAPVVGVVLLLAVTTVLAAGVAALAVGTGPPDAPPRATVTVAVDPTTDTLTLVHRGGGAIPVEPLRLRIAVDGTPLRHQPPVPFFAARGFRSGPTGPLNPASDDEWTAGERATLSLAGTNAPLIGEGSRVRVRLVVDGAVIVDRTVVASGSLRRSGRTRRDDASVAAGGTGRGQSAVEAVSSVAAVSASASGSGTVATVVIATSGS